MHVINYPWTKLTQTTLVNEVPGKRNRHIHISSCAGERAFVLLWWRHQMETFSALLAICAGNSPITGEFPAQRLVTRSIDVFFDLRQNKRLSKQSWGWWFETPSRPLWRHCSQCCWSITYLGTALHIFVLCLVYSVLKCYDAHSILEYHRVMSTLSSTSCIFKKSHNSIFA